MQITIELSDEEVREFLSNPDETLANIQEAFRKSIKFTEYKDLPLEDRIARLRRKRLLFDLEKQEMTEESREELREFINNLTVDELRGML